MPEKIWVEPISGQQVTHTPSQWGLWHPGRDGLRNETEYIRGDLIESQQARIKQLEAKITAMVEWLEKNQPDVFARGLWDAINDAEQALKGEK
jgi:hypothetical protein